MNKRRSSSTSGDETDYFDRIPVDLFISNILSRLPVKSIAQCRCVSKLWSSLIRSPNYNLLFPIKSPAPPRILFTIGYEREFFFYSSPQPHNPDENTSLVATLHHRARGSLYSVCRPPVGGLVCRQDLRKDREAVVYNPITGESLVLPELKKACELYSFVYVPIKKQFKILTIFSLCDTNKFGQYQVVTLGTGNKNILRRNIQYCTMHYRLSNEIMTCINGVLYYPAVIHGYKGRPNSFTMACFDCMSESFSFIDIDQDMSAKMISSVSLTLIDYKGRLGVCDCDIHNNHFELWVLEDAQIHKWSKHIYLMPHSWLPEMISVRAAGMIGSGDIALYPCFTVYPFFMLYYNLESNIVTRVILEVPRLLRGFWVYAFTNYVEDLKLM